MAEILFFPAYAKMYDLRYKFDYTFYKYLSIYINFLGLVKFKKKKIVASVRLHGSI